MWARNKSGDAERPPMMSTLGPLPVMAATNSLQMQMSEYFWAIAWQWAMVGQPDGWTLLKHRKLSCSKQTLVVNSSFQKVVCMTLGFNGMLATPSNKSQHWEAWHLENFNLLRKWQSGIVRDGVKEGLTNLKTKAAKLANIQQHGVSCNFIESKASKAGANTSDRCLDNVWKMFDAASKELIIPGDCNQRVNKFKWRAMVNRMQKKIKVQWGAGWLTSNSRYMLTTYYSFVAINIEAPNN
jgi:hypothetical protein